VYAGFPAGSVLAITPKARAAARDLGIKEKARILHTLLDAAAKRSNLVLTLRKYMGGS
jgi:hypothetical protein